MTSLETKKSIETFVFVEKDSGCLEMTSIVNATTNAIVNDYEFYINHKIQPDEIALVKFIKIDEKKKQGFENFSQLNNKNKTLLSQISQ